MVDHYSNYIELGSLSRNASAYSDSLGAFVAMKWQFAWQIPDELITDNGPQFKSNKYSRFAREYFFIIIKSLPYYSQGDGKVESAVKIAQSILKESQKEEEDKKTQRYHPTESVLKSSAWKHHRKKTKINGSVQQEGFTAC